MEKDRNLLIFIIILLLLISICCCCFLGTVFIFQNQFFLYSERSIENDEKYSSDKKEDGISSYSETPLVSSGEGKKNLYDSFTKTQQTFMILEETNVPENDVYEIASRLDGVVIPNEITLNILPPDYKIGDKRDFWVLNVTSNQYQLVKARLEFESPHLYFWVQEGVEFEKEDLQNLANEFEYEIYPTNREYFGSEWTPGIDNDQHLYILYTEGMGNVAGYFSSTDTLPKFIKDYSNTTEMFYLSATYTRLYQDYAYGVSAHEFQHIIHWNHDRNETSWINEGFSELAVLLNGYDVGGFDYLYAIDPDIQLNDWPGDEQGSSNPHYGASFLFMTYFLHRFGDDLTQALVSHPENGLKSIDMVLTENGVVDQQTGNVITADDVFQDWVIANYLHENFASDEIYSYGSLWSAPYFKPSEEIQCMENEINREVKQYGVDYIRLLCDSDAEISFYGGNIVEVIPTDPISGDYFFWSNKGDESDMKLTKQFDFTGHQGSLTLEYKVWYDLEKDYDYLYLIASEDNGSTWKILETSSCTRDDPTGANCGCGYNGKSEGWRIESVDLSSFAGKEIILQFEYITDLAVNGEGFALDDVRINEIGYFSDFENDEGGWIANGFVRISNQLPQKYRISLIRQKGNDYSVQKIDLDEINQVTIDIQIITPGEEVILAISGITRYTRIPADYSMSFVIK